MEIAIVTLFPEIFNALHYGIPDRAQKKGIIKLSFWNPRDYATDTHKTVDDRPYGGGPGMVMKVEPLRTTIHAAKKTLAPDVKVSYLSPQGKRLTQTDIQKLAERPQLLLVAGRYEGVDERLRQTEFDEEWSIGDFVLSGGEIPAMCLIDAVTRLIPGSLGDAESATQDSFTAGLLDFPHYTRPENILNQPVPPVLLSGDHEAIRRWRLKQSLGQTWLLRPDLLQNYAFTAEESQLLEEFIQENEAKAKKNR